MKKLLYGTFVGILLLLCLSLSVGLLVYGPSEAGANEQLSQTPRVKNEEGKLNTDYLTDLQSYVNDRFFLRQELISVDHWLSANVLKTNTESGVILGQDGWLYYEDTLDDYTGLDPLSRREMFSVSRNLSLMAAYCQENGKEFAFMIAPNKNSLYGQFMPDYGVKAEKTDAAILMEQLETLGVPTVDLFTAFDAQDEILYFAHDSHWNSKGAALGADLINEAFGVESDYFGADFSRSVPHDGDLYAMVYPAFTDPETDPVYGGELDYSFTGKATRPDAIVLTTESEAPGSLLAYRDSFGILLFPYLADSYGTAKFSRSNTYDLTGEADFVLIELVERNLSYLIDNLPVMEAPVRQIEIPQQVSGTVTVETGTRSGLTQLSGTLPAADEDSEIYVVCGDTVYEAFCLADYGFGINLPENTTAEAVICTVNGNATLYEIN